MFCILKHFLCNKNIEVFIQVFNLHPINDSKRSSIAIAYMTHWITWNHSGFNRAQHWLVVEPCAGA